MHRAWRSLRSYQFVFHWGIATQSICNYLLHVPQLLSIIEYAVLLYAAAAHLSFSISPSFSLDLARCLVLWFECGPWIDISIAVAQLLWLSILKLLLVFLSRLLISVDLSLTLTLASARFPSHSLALLLVDRQCQKDTWRSWRVMDVTAGFLFALSAAQGAKLYPLN